MNEASPAAPGTLWIVATPIGTLSDLSPRAAEVLGEVDLVLAEDTRRAKVLLGHAGARGVRLSSLHEHNEEAMLPRVLAALRGGSSVALVADAGTPVLSDPGFLLVRQARAEGIRVLSLPGPSSFTAALAASGQPPLPALLSGFLPRKGGPRSRRISELAEAGSTLVILLSPHRLREELEDLAAGLGGQRSATLLAELSKLNERAVTGSLTELADSAEARAPRGEYVVVVGPDGTGDEGGGSDLDPAAIREVYHALLAAGMDRRQAMRGAARGLGVSRRVVFGSLVDDGPEGAGGGASDVLI